MTEPTQTILDLDAMMDSTLDQIPDAPDFVTPPAGLYRLKAMRPKPEQYKNKAGAEGTRIRLTYHVVKTYETDDLPVADGSMFSETFQATQEGLGYFKKQAKNILNVSTLEGVVMRDIFDSLDGVEFDAKLTIRKSTSNGQEYENVNIRPQHSAVV